MSNNNIKKFAKFGIVLVAAITVATAAQSQGIGITTQHAYAEENTFDQDRMLYLHYTLSDQPERSWFTGDVVTPKGYTVEVPPTVDGYPYYTISGSNGKNYSVGDVITTEEPGLFGHANPEDDALNYLYYQSDPNASTSTTPSTSEAASTTPSTSEAPAVEKPSQKADDKTTATEKAKVDKKTDSKKASDKVKVEKSKDTTSEKTVAAKDNSTSKTAEAPAPAKQAKDVAVKANANVNPSENSQAIVKQADGTVDTAAVHNDNTGSLLTMLGFVGAAFIALFKKTKKEEK